MRTGFRFPLSALTLALPLAACGPDQRPPPTDDPATRSAPAPVVPEPPPPVPADAGATTTYLYQCGDWEVTASFHGDSDADISFNGRVLKLPRQAGGTGARYVDAVGNLFWVVSEGEALLSLQGQADRRCTRPPPAFR